MHSKEKGKRQKWETIDLRRRIKKKNTPQKKVTEEYDRNKQNTTKRQTATHVPDPSPDAGSQPHPPRWDMRTSISSAFSTISREATDLSEAIKPTPQFSVSFLGLYSVFWSDLPLLKVKIFSVVYNRHCPDSEPVDFHKPDDDNGNAETLLPTAVAAATRREAIPRVATPPAAWQRAAKRRPMIRLLAIIYNSVAVELMSEMRQDLDRIISFADFRCKGKARRLVLYIFFRLQVHLFGRNSYDLPTLSVCSPLTRLVVYLFWLTMRWMGKRETFWILTFFVQVLFHLREFDGCDSQTHFRNLKT